MSKRMMIPNEDKAEAIEFAKSRLFQAGIYGYAMDGYYPKSVHASRMLDLIVASLELSADEMQYTEIFKRVYGEDYHIQESNMITSFKKLGVEISPKIIYNVTISSILKQWGEFEYE